MVSWMFPSSRSGRMRTRDKRTGKMRDTYAYVGRPIGSKDIKKRKKRR